MMKNLSSISFSHLVKNLPQRLKLLVAGVFFLYTYISDVINIEGKSTLTTKRVTISSHFMQPQIRFPARDVNFSESEHFS